MTACDDKWPPQARGSWTLLTQVKMGTLARITPESVAAYTAKLAAGAGRLRR